MTKYHACEPGVALPDKNGQENKTADQLFFTANTFESYEVENVLPHALGFSYSRWRADDSRRVTSFERALQEERSLEKPTSITFNTQENRIYQAIKNRAKTMSAMQEPSHRPVKSHAVESGYKFDPEATLLGLGHHKTSLLPVKTKSTIA